MSICATANISFTRMTIKNIISRLILEFYTFRGDRMITEEQLKKNFAARLAGNRRLAGLTQLELAEKLNYSDKSISKWERGEGLPDLYVVSQLADLFNITVNDLLADGPIRRPLLTRNKLLTTLIAMALPWLTATLLFSVFGMVLPDFPGWSFFVGAMPACAIVAIVFTALWWKKPLLFASVSLLIWTLVTTVVVFVPIERTWRLYFVALVLQIVTILWFLRKK